MVWILKYVQKYSPKSVSIMVARTYATKEEALVIILTGKGQEFGKALWQAAKLHG